MSRLPLHKSNCDVLAPLPFHIPSLPLPANSLESDLSIVKTHEGQDQVMQKVSIRTPAHTPDWRLMFGRNGPEVGADTVNTDTCSSLFLVIMPYINSREYHKSLCQHRSSSGHLLGGEVVQNREWSWDSPVVAIISFFNVIRLL